MKKNISIVYFAILIISTTHVHSEIPPNIVEFTQDYYKVMGEPQLIASIVGDPEYESGETSRLFIQLINDGQIYGFEIKDEPANENETAIAKMEFNNEYDVTTAVSILGVLESRNEHIHITSGMQEGGGLRTGEISQPMEFDMEVSENVAPGTYELVLKLTYQYQYDVQVGGEKDHPEINYWYTTKNQTLPIRITVKPYVDFEIHNVNITIRPGEQGILHIIYKNMGGEIAQEAVAIIHPEDPISTTDDQSYLGILRPGDAREAQYRIKVESAALPKIYGIETEVKYRDEHGNTQTSDVMTASVRVSKTVPLRERIGITGYVLIFIIILSAAGFFLLRKREAQ